VEPTASAPINRLSWRPELKRLHRPLLATGAIMAALTAVSLAGLLLDDRILVGVPIWIKPLKFAISLTIYTVTIAWLISLLTRRRRLGWWLGTIIAVGALVEMVVIVGQVVRGRQSHFNVATPLDATLYSLMGATIVVVWLATAGIAVLLLRQRIADRAAAVAVRLGLLIGLAGLGVGFLMTRPTPAQTAAMADAPPTVVGAHSVGVADGGHGLPLVNWSTAGGDLRVGHFVGMHALQALPLLALGLTLAAGRVRRLRDERTRARLMAVAAGGYAGLVALVTWQALRGQSIVHPDAITLGTGAALLAATGIGLGWALRRADPAAPVPATDARPARSEPAH
jgi:hypothetical protein